MLFSMFRKSQACKVTLTGKRNADGAYSYKTNKAVHTHIVDVRDIEVKKRVEKAKTEASTSNKPSRKLYSEALEGANDELLARMPKQETFAKLMRAQRKGNNPTAPKNLTELVLPEITNSVNENFVLYDSGPSENRIVIFSTDTAMKFMTKCEVLHMNGTVSTGPVLFDQVYTIHGKCICFLFSYFAEVQRIKPVLDNCKKTFNRRISLSCVIFCSNNSL